MKVLIYFLFATLLLGSAALALACGPVAPAGQDATEPETPTATTAAVQPTEPPTPTATLYPPGYIKPTDLPTTTPFPTLPDPPTPAPTVFVQDSPGPTLAEQVTQFAEDEAGNYDAVARVKVVSNRQVTIPDGIQWPPMREPTFSDTNLWRTNVNVVKTYYGTLSNQYDFVTLDSLPNAALDVGREYIVFIYENFVGESEYPGEGGRRHYNQEQLDGIGGRGGIFLGEQLWIVDGDTAWRIPVEHILEGPSGSDLAAAKAGGESLLVTELEVAIVTAFR